MGGGRGRGRWRSRASAVKSVESGQSVDSGQMSFIVAIVVKRLLAGCGERVAVKSIDAGQSVDLQWSRCRWWSKCQWWAAAARAAAVEYGQKWSKAAEVVKVSIVVEISMVGSGGESRCGQLWPMWSKSAEVVKSGRGGQKWPKWSNCRWRSSAARAAAVISDQSGRSGQSFDGGQRRRTRSAPAESGSGQTAVKGGHENGQNRPPECSQAAAANGADAAGERQRSNRGQGEVGGPGAENGQNRHRTEMVKQRPRDRGQRATKVSNAW